MNKSCRMAGTAAAALAVVTTGGCAVDVAPGGPGKVHAVASFYPLEYITERIGGGHVHVTGLTKPGTEPHALELTPQQTGMLSAADLVVYLKGLQPAVDRAVEQAEPPRVTEAGEAAHLEEHGPGHDHHDGEEHGDSHAHTAGDPHFWLDPTLLAEVAKAVRDRLADADPAHAADYRANSDRLVAQLKGLDKEFSEGLAHVKNRTFITTHAAFGHLAKRYRLKEHAISGLDPEAEPSPARLAELQRTARREKVTTVFFETLGDSRAARTMARDLGLKTAVLDPIEGVRDPAKDDYFSVMRRNLTNLKAALGTL